MTKISARLQAVRERITTACANAGRPLDAVALLAVSKTFGPDAVQEAFATGQTAFGENYIQEGVDKITALRHLPITWHMIGPVQSNKTRLVAEHFDWVQSIDRIKIAQRLSDQRPAHLPALQVCIQVNIDGGANKSGVAPEDALELALQVAKLPHLQLRGLMFIPEIAINFVAARACYIRCKALFDHLFEAILHQNDPAAPQNPGKAFDTLSMGMSADLDAAIQAGSSMVRVGTAIFGNRSVGPENEG
jgi:pyridoxal phosphate enzyme (YggS family)